MVDILGQELKIGDKIAFASSKEIVTIGQLKSFGKVQVQIEYNGGNTIYRYPQFIVKIG